MSRAIRDVALPNLGVGLDTANLILYGKANPVDAVAILGPHVHAIHAKDGRWPTNPDKLGEEVLIGTGLVDFAQGLRRTAQSRLHRRHHHRARNPRAQADRGCPSGKGVSRKSARQSYIELIPACRHPDRRIEGNCFSDRPGPQHRRKHSSWIDATSSRPPPQPPASSSSSPRPPSAIRPTPPCASGCSAAATAAPPSPPPSRRTPQRAWSHSRTSSPTSSPLGKQHFDELNASLNVPAIDPRLTFHGYRAFEELAASKDVDAIQISTPPFFHVQHLEAVVAGGKHAYCEKPVGVDVPQTRQSSRDRHNAPRARSASTSASRSAARRPSSRSSTASTPARSASSPASPPTTTRLHPWTTPGRACRPTRRACATGSGTALSPATSCSNRTSTSSISATG